MTFDTSSITRTHTCMHLLGVDEACTLSVEVYKTVTEGEVTDCTDAVVASAGVGSKGTYVVPGTTVEDDDTICTMFKL